VGNARRIHMLRNAGMLIGEGCIIANSARFSEPHLVKLGNRVRITNELAFINHQGATWVFRESLNITTYAATIVGDNVLIGSRSIILGGVSIGENTVIGAGSVVTKNCLAESVYAGNPARRVSDVYDYIERRKLKHIPIPLDINERNQFLKSHFFASANSKPVISDDRLKDPLPSQNQRE